jgi:hypothetical protein
MKTRYSILVIILLFSVPSIYVSGQQDTLLSSSWLEKQVIIDGRMTSSNEWSDSRPIELQLNSENSNDSPYSAKMWSKNDETWLYFLIRIVSPLRGTDPPACAAQIDYFWGPFDDPWTNFDITTLNCDGYPWDGYGYNTDDPIIDTLHSPPGENNLEGYVTHDGTYYWFEFRKPLDSGDGYDWSFETGKVYGLRTRNPDTGGFMSLVFWDNEEDISYVSPIQLNVSTRTSIENTDSDTNRETNYLEFFNSLDLREIVYLISIIGTAFGIGSWGLNKRTMKRKNELLFSQLLSDVEDIYSRFKTNSNRCESELLSVREKVFDQLTNNVLNEDKCLIVMRRIDSYLNEIREEIIEK